MQTTERFMARLYKYRVNIKIGKLANTYITKEGCIWKFGSLKIIDLLENNPQIIVLKI